jgi:hypothetical protein
MTARISNTFLTNIFAKPRGGDGILSRILNPLTGPTETRSYGTYPFPPPAYKRKRPGTESPSELVAKDEARMAAAKGRDGVDKNIAKLHLDATEVTISPKLFKTSIEPYPLSFYSWILLLFIN